MDDLNSLGSTMADRFFKERDKELLEKLKEEVAGEGSRDALAAASGISDASVLDSLIGSGIGPDTIASVSLIPLVAVAWADNKMEDKEREAILKAAAEAGIKTGSASYAILEKWLGEQPQLKGSIVSRAESVAEAAGGFLGLGNKVSDSERGVLSKLESAFA